MADAISEDRPLARLRDDLEISPGAPFLSGAPGWVIRDPVRHKFYQIGQRTIDVLSRWSAGSVEALKARLFSEKAIRLSDEEFDTLLGFLMQNQLLEVGQAGTAKHLAGGNKPQGGTGGWLAAQKLLFFKVPLVRPEGFLRATWPIVRPLFSRTFLWISLGFLVFGLYLASRQQASLEAHFQQAFTWAGAALFAVAIALVKALHELGHAYQALRRGLRVPVMGVAFFVFLPLLYTDITDAWRLRNRRDRIMVDLGGIFVELTIAIYATVFWCFLPDGPTRTIAFAIATSSWVLSLLVNLNPFMRFDGYYLLADTLGIQNMQNRAFALGKWALRRGLLGLMDPAPEVLPTGMRRFLIVYAYGVWIYRFFLFVGISVLVYAMFFKLAGAILLVVSVTAFIAKPIFRELAFWFGARDRIWGSWRAALTLVVLGGALLAFFWPMSTRIHVPAVLEEARQQSVFPPEAAQLGEVFVAEGQRVAAGDPLFRFTDPELPARIEQSKTRIALQDARILSGAGDLLERAEGTVLARVRDEESETLSALQDRQSRLLVIAAMDGEVRELSTDLTVGTWFPRTHLLGRIIDHGALSVRGFINEDDLGRLDLSKDAVFMADEVTIPPLDIDNIDVSDFAIDRLPDGYLARPNGGPIAIASADGSDLLVAGVWYQANGDLSIDGAAPALRDDRVYRGVIVMHSQPHSLASRIAHRIAKVVIRELEF